MDFTLKKYKELLQILIEQDYSFQTFEEFVKKPEDKVVVLRHDVDRRSINAIWLAKIEQTLNLKASYYFRIVPESNVESVIEQIVSMKHEVGYHYEDLGMAKGNYEVGYENYMKNLTYFRKFYPVTTVCMHGSPESSIDNRDIWNKYDYKKDGIIAEPYFDVDYNEVFYITDTGRAWNKKSVIVRDKVDSKINIPIKSIDHMMSLISQNKLPAKLIISTHPHRWFNFGFLWFVELIMQNIKNVVKAILIRYRK